MPPHRLTNFEIQKYYQNEPRFNGVYSRDNLPRIKDRVHIILISTLILELIGLLCMYEIKMLLILIVLELNTFQRKSKHLLVIKT